MNLGFLIIKSLIIQKSIVNFKFGHFIDLDFFFVF